MKRRLTPSSTPPLLCPFTFFANVGGTLHVAESILCSVGEKHKDKLTDVFPASWDILDGMEARLGSRLDANREMPRPPAAKVTLPGGDWKVRQLMPLGDGKSVLVLMNKRNAVPMARSHQQLRILRMTRDGRCNTVTKDLNPPPCWDVFLGLVQANWNLVLGIFATGIEIISTADLSTVASFSFTRNPIGHFPPININDVSLLPGNNTFFMELSGSVLHWRVLDLKAPSSLSVKDYKQMRMPDHKTYYRGDLWLDNRPWNFDSLESRGLFVATSYPRIPCVQWATLEVWNFKESQLLALVSNDKGTLPLYRRLGLHRINQRTTVLLVENEMQREEGDDKLFFFDHERGSGELLTSSADFDSKREQEIFESWRSRRTAGTALENICRQDKCSFLTGSAFTRRNWLGVCEKTTNPTDGSVENHISFYEH